MTKCLQEKWNQLDKLNRSNYDGGYSFCKWLHYYQSNIVKEKCGKTNSKEFTANGAENVNSQIKGWCVMKNYHFMNLLQ